MSNIEDKATNRVSFLAEQFNILDNVEFEEILKIEDDNIGVIMDINENPLAIIISTVKKTSNYNGNEVISLKKVVKIHENVFINIVQADPTSNKIYIQWLLTTFTRMLKDNLITDAIGFASEDLPLAHDNLKLFDDNKRKQLFKKLCKSHSDLLNIEDPTNINQYKNLEQVFDVIDPFIERDASSLEKSMLSFVNLGEALIPVRDRNFTLYIPMSVNASVIFNNFTNWCTTVPDNGMFKSYTNNLQPNGENSKLYIIIDNNLFKGESNELWQLHIQSRQLMDRSDKQESNFFDKVLSKSKLISNFFYNELIVMAKEVVKVGDKNKSNVYLDYLLDFGHPEAMFDVLSEYTPAIAFSKKIIPTIPNLSRFKNVEFIYIEHSKMSELHESIVGLDNLETLSIPYNNIETLPRYLGDCRNLIFINLVGNKIKNIPNDITKLDPINGGNLRRISIRKEDIGEDNYKKLIKLLPSVDISSVLTA